MFPEFCRDTVGTGICLAAKGAPVVRSRHERAIFNQERPMMRRTYDLRQASDCGNLRN